MLHKYRDKAKCVLATNKERVTHNWGTVKRAVKNFSAAHTHARTQTHTHRHRQNYLLKTVTVSSKQLPFTSRTAPLDRSPCNPRPLTRPHLMPHRIAIFVCCTATTTTTTTDVHTLVVCDRKRELERGEREKGESGIVRGQLQMTSWQCAAQRRLQLRQRLRQRQRRQPHWGHSALLRIFRINCECKLFP